MFPYQSETMVYDCNLFKLDNNTEMVPILGDIHQIHVLFSCKTDIRSSFKLFLFHLSLMRAEPC